MKNRFEAYIDDDGTLDCKAMAMDLIGLMKTIRVNKEEFLNDMAKMWDHVVVTRFDNPPVN